VQNRQDELQALNRKQERWLQREHWFTSKGTGQQIITWHYYWPYSMHFRIITCASDDAALLLQRPKNPRFPRKVVMHWRQFFFGLLYQLVLYSYWCGCC